MRTGTGGRAMPILGGSHMGANRCAGTRQASLVIRGSGIARASVRSIAVAALLFLSGAARAGHQVPGAIPWELTDFAPGGEVLFACQLRYFDIARNGGLVPCYGPDTIRLAYGAADLLASGFDGTGETLVLLEAYGSPTAFSDLQVFDATWGLPDPPEFRMVTMPGTPAFDPGNATMVSWAYETSLDVQWSHAMAPGARIVVVAAASDDDMDLSTALDFALDRSLGQVVSMSFGESEHDANPQAIDAWEKAFAKARRKQVTVLASSGDEGSTVTEERDANAYVYAFRNVSYPASSPQVTAVGGTNLRYGEDGHADPAGAYLGERVWNDEAQGIAGVGGGGVSVLFPEPEYQRGLPDSVRRALGGFRGLPDVAYNAGVVGGVVAYVGFPGVTDGYYVFGGTSAGPPQWAGIVSDLNEGLGRPSGFLNRRLYQLGRLGVTAGLFHDVTRGNNGFCYALYPTGAEGCVPGFSAEPGWDLATGYGTPNFGRLGRLLSEPDGGDGK